QTSNVPGQLVKQVILNPIRKKRPVIPPYFDMCYAVRQALEQTKKWIVIGYSFADEVIRAMLARASTSDTVLVLVHPDNSTVKKIESEPGWQGKIKYISARFGETTTNQQIAQGLR